MNVLLANLEEGMESELWNATLEEVKEGRDSTLYLPRQQSLPKESTTPCRKLPRGMKLEGLWRLDHSEVQKPYDVSRSGVLAFPGGVSTVPPLSSAEDDDTRIACLPPSGWNTFNLSFSRASFVKEKRQPWRKRWGWRVVRELVRKSMRIRLRIGIRGRDQNQDKGMW